MAGTHWTTQLFLEHADVYLRIHEHAVDRAEGQARAVGSILEREGVHPPARILDAPCGIGRHDVHLAKAGYRVTGLDFAPAFLDRARRLAVETGTDPEFVLGDLREACTVLAGRGGSFSAILNLWTSIGYWGDDDDRRILRQFHTLAAPDGLLIIDTINRDWLVRALQPQGYEEWGDLVHVEERTFDFRTSWILGPWRFYRKHGGDLLHLATMSVDHRVYSGHELRRLAHETGWRVTELFGGLEREPLTAERPRTVLVARKEG